MSGTSSAFPSAKLKATTKYDKNIQIADLNALNAALAVIRSGRSCSASTLTRSANSIAPTRSAEMMSTIKMPRNNTPRKKPLAVALTHEFVEFVPDELAPNTLYISMPFATATHISVSVAAGFFTAAAICSALASCVKCVVKRPFLSST